MKINAINSASYMTTCVSFKHSAVPYPEYESAYYKNTTQPDAITRVVDKISALFTPEVTKKSQEIKNDINKIYNNGKSINVDFSTNPKNHLLSVLA